MGRTKRTFTPEFKREAVRMITEGRVPIATASRDLAVSASLLGRWKQLAAESDPALAAPGRSAAEEIQRLKRELARTQQERDFLKKVSAYFAKEPR